MERRAKGEGNMKLRTDGRWELRINLDGKRKSFYGKTPTLTKKKYKDFIEKLNNKKNIGNLIFEEYIVDWLTKVKSKELKPTSYDRIESIINTHIIPSIGFYLIDEIDCELLQSELINVAFDKGLSYSSVKKIYETTNACFKWAVTKRQLQFNPMDGVTNVTSMHFEKKEIRVVLDEHKKKIVAEINRKYNNSKSVYSNGLGLLIMLYTGLRQGELLGLKWKDYDRERKILHVVRNVSSIKDRSENPKKNWITVENPHLKTRGSRRVLALNNKAIGAIESLMKFRGRVSDDENMICSRNGGLWNARYLQKLFDSVLRNSGVEHYNLHALRHTYASEQFRKGIDVKIISAQLGHSSIVTTYDTYIHIINEVEAKKLSASGILNAV